MNTDKLSKQEGMLLLKIARDNIESYLKNQEYNLPEDLPDIFHEELGVFVTINLDNQLRGCIGYPEPVKALIDAVLDVSLSAAFDDPRFNPLTLAEFKNIKLEISVLTKPELIKVNNYNDYLSEIEIGRDGLIIENSFRRGLLLPQVPLPYNWNVEEFLEALCYKAGLSNNTWKDEKTQVYSFQAQIFEEE